MTRDSASGNEQADRCAEAYKEHIAGVLSEAEYLNVLRGTDKSRDLWFLLEKLPISSLPLWQALLSLVGYAVTHLMNRLLGEGVFDHVRPATREDILKVMGEAANSWSGDADPASFAAHEDRRGANFDASAVEGLQGSGFGSIRVPPDTLIATEALALTRFRVSIELSNNLAGLGLGTHKALEILRAAQLSVRGNHADLALEGSGSGVRVRGEPRRAKAAEFAFALVRFSDDGVVNGAIKPPVNESVVEDARASLVLALRGIALGLSHIHPHDPGLDSLINYVVGNEQERTRMLSVVQSCQVTPSTFWQRVGILLGSAIPKADYRAFGNAEQQNVESVRSLQTLDLLCGVQRSPVDPSMANRIELGGSSGPLEQHTSGASCWDIISHGGLPVAAESIMSTDKKTDPLASKFEEAIEFFDLDLQTFARINFYERRFPLNPHRRQLNSEEVKQVFALIKTIRSGR